MRIAIIPGDGIGPEVTAEAIKALEVLRSARLDPAASELSWTTFDYGAERYLRDGTTLPADTIDDFRDNYQAILLGAAGDPRVPDNRHARDIVMGLRRELDLFINLRPAKTLDTRLCPLRGDAAARIDLVCFRENTEGLYADVGGILKRGTPDEVAINEDVNTRRGVERIIRAAFEYARTDGREHVCMSDKHNALRYAHDLWRRVFAEVREEYPDITSTHRYIDVLAMELVQKPQEYQVIVTCNLFGDIVSDLSAALVGGLGVAASANINPRGVSMFEPVHGSAPDIAGRGLANPMGALLSTALMLERLGLQTSAARLEQAVAACVRESHTTADLGGNLRTKDVGDRVCRAIRRNG